MSNEAVVNDEWRKINDEIQRITPDYNFKKRIDFPHATIRKIMNAELAAQNVRKRRNGQNPVKFFIAQETTLAFAMACEFFVREIAKRAWAHTSNSTRKTLQKADVYAAANDTDVMDFLIDIVPRVASANVDLQAQDTPTIGAYLPDQIGLVLQYGSQQQEPQPSQLPNPEHLKDETQEEHNS